MPFIEEHTTGFCSACNQSCRAELMNVGNDFCPRWEMLSVCCEAPLVDDLTVRIAEEEKP